MSIPVPQYPKSKLIKNVIPDKVRIHKGDGDMWPITWAADDNLYGGAGDNCRSPINVWKIIDSPEPYYSWVMYIELINNKPVDPKLYCQRPNVDHARGIKPAGLLGLNGKLYMACELHNYGDNPAFNRQHNISSWIIASDDFGLSWDLNTTEQDFFTGRLASPHFLQFGRDYEGARDEYIYAYFTAADDGNSYWCNGDYMLLGRVEKDKLLIREEWEFFVRADESGNTVWTKDEALSQPIFRYPLMTGENHVSYNKGLKRYILGNFSFLDKESVPTPYHQKWPDTVWRSQLTLFEAPEPWGPWSLFYQDDDWGTYGDYQPNFPTKWMSEDGKTMWMVSSGSYDDYNFTVQKLTLELY
jgi:hypothetical protein